jgi:hypothetical protein
VIACESGFGAKESTAMIPERIVILLSGIPATRKSTFAQYLTRKHGFAHYDLEHHPQGWPHPELKNAWDTSRRTFIARLCQCHNRVVLDWGFPVHCFSWVKELRDCGVRLIWFDGDIDRARQEFVKRGGIDPARFDEQVAAIKTAGYPTSLDCLIVRALTASGVFPDPRKIERSIFV